ncbi:Imm63 family immunity protein [Paenibacillus xylanivorans]|uniref:Imm63 family immunity protein n=1 Tax=Paenibacillus xylanivorans TaxID=1705561 RepID=UPI0006B234DF|nr:Imm63 family immunity protein [Paenibacillus xylanivorans]
MSNIQSKLEIAQTLLQLLERTSFRREQMDNYVNRLFEAFKWEGVPYVESENNAYVVRIYERGIVMLEKRLNQTDEVMYWLLEDIIFTAVHVELLERHGVDNKQTHLNYTGEVKQELDRSVEKAFQQIGDPYLQLHLTGKRQELERLKPRGGRL